jgi:predicted O-methyltransferase YrrM
MTEAVRAFLQDLYQQGVEGDTLQADRRQRRRNLEPDSAALLALMVQAVSAKQVVEIGTSNGYSTIWFADALSRTGGRILSVDTDAAVQTEAARNLRACDLAAWAHLQHGDGGSVLASLPEASVDVLFLDAERPAYASWWPRPRQVLRPGGMLMVDNVLSHSGEVAEFRSLLEADPLFTSTVVAVGKGVLLAVKAIE